MTRPTIVLAGGAGFLGRHLAAHFAALGYPIVVLSRRPRPDTAGVRTLRWDGVTLGPWAAAVDGAAAVINLAGRTVNCRYTAQHRREIYDSRLLSTKVIGEAIAAARTPPAVWVNASSATIYRDARDRPMDELTGDIGDGFSVDVVQKWEVALHAATTPATRRIALRAAMVFGVGADGVYEAFRRIVKLGLGGTLGDGGQYVSWVHARDFCRAVQFVIDRADLAGPVNLSSPNPAPNRDFMRTLRRAVGKRIGLPAVRWMLEVGAFVLRTETELLLKSRRVVPGKLLAAGFTFDFPDLGRAIAEIEAARGSP
jgi:uncharacterized protein